LARYKKESPSEEREYLLYCCNNVKGIKKHYFYTIGIWKNNYNDFICVVEKSNIVAWNCSKLLSPPNFI
jgi:uncharacterized protein YktB (UPF0637 family)